jgi:DNA-binding response OmpR family regulator
MTVPTPMDAALPATIALVDDDRNILTSVSIGLQAEGFQTRFMPMAKRRCARFRTNQLIWACLTSRCRAWTG